MSTWIGTTWPGVYDWTLDRLSASYSAWWEEKLVCVSANILRAAGAILPRRILSRRYFKYLPAGRGRGRACICWHCTSSRSWPLRTRSTYTAPRPTARIVSRVRECYCVKRGECLTGALMSRFQIQVRLNLMLENSKIGQHEPPFKTLLTAAPQAVSLLVPT